MFELTVLFSAFTAFFAMLIMNGLPRWYHPIFNWDRFSRATNDGFFLVIEARDPRFTEIEARELLEQNRRSTHHHRARGLIMLRGFFLIFYPGRHRDGRVLRFPRATAAPARRIEIFPDMVRQPKVRAQAPLGFFADGRGLAFPIAGTVPIGYEMPKAASEAAPGAVPVPAELHAQRASRVQRRHRLLQHRQNGQRTGELAFRCR